MSAVSLVLLILGAGSDVGASVARTFAAKGYKVALASWAAMEEDSSQNQLHTACDLSGPTSAPSIFANCCCTQSRLSGSTFNAFAEFKLALNINTISIYAAAQVAAKGFAELPIEASRTFIYTGSMLNTIVFPPLLGLGCAGQRKFDGSPLYVCFDGEAQAKFYDKLTRVKSQGQWHQTLVKDVEYRRF
ncbi:hypothetical protein N7523_005417 [Penicillium sp. IBT 18751x]|nr:hypothetical protein N7523_005417 [Penicillium sp. IBT 18751x]